MKIPSIYELIELIPKNQNEKITARSLAKLTGTTEPYIRKLINEGRAAGISICSTRHGYYLSKEIADISKTIRFLTNRVNTQLQAIQGLQKLLPEVDG